MAGEEASATMAEQTPKVTEILEANKASVEATIESAAEGVTESTCNNNNDNVGETSGVSADEDREKTVEFSDELMDRGRKALKESDYSEASDCFSRALEIRVTHYGEHAVECLKAYYQFGHALLYKAQEGADPLVSVKCGLDLAWKMLDVARAIAEKHSGSTMDKVDILVALAEVSLERDDIETSLGDYQKALSILEQLVEPDSRLIAELNSCISSCLEIALKPQEAIPYCQKAIAVCKARVQQLMNELKSSTESAALPVSELDDGIHQSSNACQKDKILIDREAEIETLTALTAELEKELEDLQEMILNPQSNLLEMLGMEALKAKGNKKIASSAAMSSSRMGSSAGSGVAHLGTVGREKELEDLQEMILNPQSNLLEMLGMEALKAKDNKKIASSAAMSSSQMGSTAGSGVAHLGTVGREVKQSVNY